MILESHDQEHDNISWNVKNDRTLSSMQKMYEKIEFNQERQQHDMKNLQKKPHPQKNSYRPDIDGLRALAIILVIIFHAFPQSMPGGFIGVDVFFVISGYLISQIIIKETLNQNFSYTNFYSRRIKRIYPALILTLAFVLYMIPKYYSTTQLQFTLKTLNASVFFGANFQVLMHQKDYFDPDVHTNPLLHLWSLGVEEQFYIIWPCLIGLSLKKFKSRSLFILVVYTFFSFIFGIVSVYISPKFAFYFPICRFWQMAIGGLVAYLGHKIGNKKISNALSLTGIFVILVTAWIINDQYLFPGFWALIPTLASASIIQAGNESYFNKHILSNRIVVFVGKISYPMYMWHWPLLVFSRYLYPPGSTSIFSNLHFIIAITVIISILTYFFFENPVRRSKSKIFVIILLFFMLSIGAWSYLNLRASRIRNNQFDRSTIDQVLQNAEKQYLPRPQDFVQKNGKMHPNLSINKNRKFPTVQATKIPVWSQNWDKQNDKQIILEKRIQEGSKYYIKDRPFLKNFEVANEGKQNQLFIVGDSHALKLTYRFQQLFYDSVANNKTDTFPTIVAIIRTSYELSNSNYVLNLSLAMFKQHKPKRVLLACFWLVYVMDNRNAQHPVYKQEKYQKIFGQFYDYIRQIQKMGIQVSVLTLDMHHKNYHPSNMVDFYGIIPENIKPIKRSQFRKKYQRLIDDFQTNLKQLNVDIIDTTDNLCYEDVCEVTTPSGYAVFVDQNHYGKFCSRHWLSCVDHLVQF